MAQRMLQDKGFPIPPSMAFSYADVEQKLAARMVHHKIRDATLVLNKEPCTGPYGCDALVPILLPQGYTMTVYAPGYRKTFSGGEAPWWR